MIGTGGMSTIIMDVIKIRVVEIKIMIINLSMIEIKVMIKGNIPIMTLMDIMTITNGPGMLIQIIDTIEIMVMIVEITDGMMMMIIGMIAEITVMIHLIIGIIVEEIVEIMMMIHHHIEITIEEIGEIT